MAVFNLLHLSDLHIARHPNRTALQAVAARFGGDPDVGLFASHDKTVAESASFAISEIYGSMLGGGSGIDMVVISGDLATTGDPSDLRTAEAFIDSYVRRNSRRLNDGSDRALFLIPGNHDRFDLTGNAGAASFENVFGKYWPGRAGGSKRRLKAVVIEKMTGARTDFLGLIGADFSLEFNSDATLSAWPTHWGQGMATDESIGALENETKSLRREFKRICVVWVIHFPPVSSIRQNLLLRNSLFVRRSAVRLHVPLILCGHLHENRIFRVRKGRQEVWCAGSTCQHGEPHGHYLHLVEMITEGAELLRAFRRDFKCHYGRFEASFFRDQYGKEKQIIP